MAGQPNRGGTACDTWLIGANLSCLIAPGSFGSGLTACNGSTSPPSHPVFPTWTLRNGGGSMIWFGRICGGKVVRTQVEILFNEPKSQLRDKHYRKTDRTQLLVP